MDSNTIKKIKQNLFYKSHDAINNYSAFPWHKYKEEIQAYKENSSQALSIDVLGTLKNSKYKDDIINSIAKLNDLPESNNWEITLEWTDEENILNENRKTQIDTMITSENTEIYIECKFGEKQGGKCSQIDKRKDGKIQCNGSYKMQRNPVNGVNSKCSLSGKSIRYWDYIPQFTNYTSTQDYEKCPFKGETYQWMRNVCFAWVSYKEKQKNSKCIVVYADHPDLPIANKMKSKHPLGGLSKNLTFNLFSSMTYQDIIKIAKSVVQKDYSELNIWEELEQWIIRKINNVGNHIGNK